MTTGNRIRANGGTTIPTHGGVSVLRRSIKTARRIAAVGAVLIAMSACHPFRWLHAATGCRASQEYQRAAQVAPLRVPAGLDAPNTQGALKVPEVEANPTLRGPNDPCLEEPPQYRPTPSNRPAAPAT